MIYYKTILQIQGFKWHYEDIENDEDEIVIMRVNQQGEEYSLEFIESDEEFDRVREYLEQLEDEAAEE